MTGKKTLIVLTAIMLSVASMSQPYLDPVQVMYHASPGGDPKTFNHFRAQGNMPFIFKDSSIFLINPIWEERWIKISEQSEKGHFRGFITWLTYSRNISPKWAAMLAFIPRWNGETSIQFSEGFQAGGAALLTYKKNPSLHLKFGVYYNSEFWGSLIIPLFGLDWKINKKQRLFGILPGYFTYENRINSRFSWGGNFRTFTNSYKLQNSSPVSSDADFMRIDDNQLGAYTDFYLSPKVVLNAEAGYSILRKVRTGYGKTSNDDFSVLSKNNALYFRINLQYRIRLDK